MWRSMRCTKREVVRFRMTIGIICFIYVAETAFGYLEQE